MQLSEQGEPADALLVGANPAFEKHAGISREQATGRKLSDLLPSAAERGFLLGKFAEVVRERRSLAFEFPSEHFGRDFLFNTYPIGDTRFVVIFPNDTSLRGRLPSCQE